MECDICMLEWDPQKRIPRLLVCGHTFCEVCLLSLLIQSKTKHNDFFCPNCMMKQKEIKKEEDIKSLIKNYNLLRIVEKIESRKTVITNRSFLAAEKSVLNDNSFNTSSLIQNNLMKEEPEIDNMSATDQKCKKHLLPVHSYAIGTNILFCDKCIQETNLKTYPLPNVLKDLRRKIDSNQVKICLLKNDIERLRDFFSSYQDEFERSNKAKIEDLFNYLYKIVTYNLNAAMHLLNQCKAEQKIHFDQRLKELSDLEQELNEMETDFSQINLSDDRQIIKQNDKINKAQQKVINFINYDLELNLLSMKIGVKEEIKNLLFNTIQDSYYVDVEFMEIQGECPTIKHILQKEKYWSCICGELNNSVSEIRCSICSSFRRLETINYLYSDPTNVSHENIKLVNLRRKEESLVFQENIKLNSENVFFPVELEWFLQWKCFVMNDVTEKFLPNSKKKISINKLIGVLPPGPITNINLFEKNCKEFSEKTLKKELKKNEDYVIVNDKIWKLFLNNYNGGPEILTKKNDNIYISLVSISCKDFIAYNIMHDNLNSTTSHLNNTTINSEFLNDNENKFIHKSDDIDPIITEELKINFNEKLNTQVRNNQK